MSDHINQHIAALLKQADDLTAEALSLTRNAAHALSRAQVARETAADLQVMLAEPAPAPYADQDDAQRAIWRQEYNALPPADREAYGGFAGFVVAKGGVDRFARDVQHVDTLDEEPAGIPPHVYLYRNMLTDLQRLAPLGIDETNGQYAVAIDQLTDDQCQIPHVQKQLHAELNRQKADLLSVVVEGDVLPTKARRSAYTKT